MTPPLTAAQSAAIDRGWAAADVDPAELVDDAWIAENTSYGQAPALPARLMGALPRSLRRTLTRGGITRDQMRRIAARTGYPYVEAWSAHNAGGMSGVWGALVHHTGTDWSAPGDYPTLKVVRDGRTNLVNSLCMFGLGKSGTIYLVSEKVSWHAGVGEYNGLTAGNSYLAGIEAESDGVHWTAEEIDCYPRLVASILVEIGQTDPRPGYGDKYTTRHASWALPRGRKTDASGLDMDRFWNQVYAYLANPASINRNYGKTPPPAPPASASTHTVAAGDTLYALSVRYKVSVAQLTTWNGLKSTTLAVGQVLKVKAPAAAPAPKPAPAGMPTTLAAGRRLTAGQGLKCGGWTANMQPDGNFVVYGNGVAKWSTNTAGQRGAYLELQTDGNLVLYSAARKPLWSTGTVGKGGARLTMQGDGNLVLYTTTGRAVWDRW